MKMVARPFQELTVGFFFLMPNDDGQKPKKNKKNKKKNTRTSFHASLAVPPFFSVVLGCQSRLLTLLTTQRRYYSGNIFITLEDFCFFLSPTPTKIPGFVFSLTGPKVISFSENTNCCSYETTNKNKSNSSLLLLLLVWPFETKKKHIKSFQNNLVWKVCHG